MTRRHACSSRPSRSSRSSRSSRPSRPSRLLHLLLLLGLALSLHGLPPASAAPSPDLKVTGLEVATGTVVAGSRLGISDTVKNTGRRKAGRSLVRFYLSRDAAWSKSDVLLGKRRVPRLAPGALSRRSVDLPVPRTVAARRYFVVSCADAKDVVRESREGNNCRATDRKVQVEAGGGTFPLEPDPLSVDSTLQTGRAVTGTAWAWDLDGASELVATAQDGTTYTLSVPYRALWSTEQITLTPVASVAGLPLSGGLVAGVQIEPHGLLLQEPATLTIESPDAGALGAQTGFLFHEEGADFHTYPMDAPQAGDDKDVVRMTLTHFSTAGVGLATRADRAAVAERPPARSQSQMQQAVSALLSGERQSQLNGNPPDPGVGEQVEALHNAYYDDVLRGQLQAAETNADLGPQAIAEGLGWARARALLGDEDNPRTAEILQRVEKILKNMMNEYWTRCTVDHEVVAAAWLVGLARQAALMGYAWQEEAADKAQRCANFEVRLDSRISGWYDQPGQNQSHQSKYLYHVRSVVEVPWTGSAYGAVTYSDFNYFYRIDYDTDACVAPNHYTEIHGTGTLPGSLWAALLARPNPAEASPETGTSPPPTMTLRIHLGSSADGPAPPQETYRTEAYSCGSYSSDQTRTGWLDAFGSLHANTAALVHEFPAGAGEVVFTKAWNRTVPETWREEREDTTLEVWHKPLR